MKERKKQTALCVLLVFLGMFMLSAQETDNATEQTTENEPLKTATHHALETFRHTLLAVGETIEINLLINAWDYVVLDQEWAAVGIDSIKHNLTHGWHWDEDDFKMNQLGHPYQGSLYFNSGRANGFNFWQSSLLTMFGSAMWEICMETSKPSINDIITTTIAGSIAGEAMHRLYVDVYKKAPWIAWLISPQDGINDLFQWKKPDPVKGHTTLVEAYLSTGMLTTREAFQNSAFSTERAIKIPTGGIALHVVYGNPYGHDTEEMFDQFNLSLEADFAPNEWSAACFIDGLLFSRSLWDYKPYRTTVGIDLQYKTIYASLLQYYNTSFGVLFAQQTESEDSGWTISWKANASYIALGGSDTYYVFSDTNYFGLRNNTRTYQLGTGASAQLACSLSHPKAGTLSLNAAADFLWNWPGTYSNDTVNDMFSGTTFIQYGSVSYEHVIYKNYSIGIADFLYHKSAVFHDIPSVEQLQNVVRIYLKMQF